MLEGKYDKAIYAGRPANDTASYVPRWRSPTALQQSAAHDGHCYLITEPP